MLIQPFREILPEMLRGFWEVYPGRFCWGPLKLIGYPATFGFLLTVAVFFSVFHLLMLVLMSPKLIWWLFTWRPGVGGAAA
jgi:hypothetical protein